MDLPLFSLHEMQSNSSYGRNFQRTFMSRKIPVAEIREGYFFSNWGFFLSTIKADIVQNGKANGDSHESLFLSREQVIYVGGFCLSLDLCDRTDSEGKLFAVVTKQNPIAAISVLKSGHHATPISPHRRYHFGKSQGKELRRNLRNPFP